VIVFEENDGERKLPPRDYPQPSGIADKNLPDEGIRYRRQNGAGKFRGDAERRSSGALLELLSEEHKSNRLIVLTAAKKQTR